MFDVYLQRIFPRIQDKSGVDDLSGQREHVERPVNEMIPVSGDIQTSQFVVASRFVFDWKMYLFLKQLILHVHNGQWVAAAAVVNASPQHQCEHISEFRMHSFHRIKSRSFHFRFRTEIVKLHGM